jgi:hypothetical protein
VPEPDPTGDEHRDHDERQHQGGSEVGLAHHEEAEPRQHEDNGLHHPSPVVDFRAATVHEIGGVEQQRELRQLARLEAHEIEAEPAPRPRHVDADAGHEHDDEQCRARDHQWRHQALPPPVVDADTDHERHDAEDGPDELAEEEVPR